MCAHVDRVMHSCSLRDAALHARTPTDCPIDRVRTLAVSYTATQSPVHEAVWANVHHQRTTIVCLPQSAFTWRPTRTDCVGTPTCSLTTQPRHEHALSHCLRVRQQTHPCNLPVELRVRDNLIGATFCGHRRRSHPRRKAGRQAGRQAHAGTSTCTTHHVLPRRPRTRVREGHHCGWA
jgi:hypothetical protein